MKLEMRLCSRKRNDEEQTSKFHLPSNNNRCYLFQRPDLKVKHESKATLHDLLISCIFPFIQKQTNVTVSYLVVSL